MTLANLKKAAEAAQARAAQNMDPAAAAATPVEPEISTATSIREKIEDRTLGCGCLGAIMMMLFGAYALGAMWLDDTNLGLTAAVVAAAVGLFAAKLRGYHVWTGIAYLGLTITGFGATALAYSLIFPEQAAELFPAWMSNPLWSGGITTGGAAFTVFTWTQQRRSISTPESMYAIQFHAAASRIDADILVERFTVALERLEHAGNAGLYPLSADFIDFGDVQEPPPGVPADKCFLPLLAIRVQPEDTPETAFDDTPAARLPETLTASVKHMAPIAVGVLYCDADTLHFAPLRSTQEQISLPLTSLTHYTLRANAFDLTAEGHPKPVVFATVHAWRMVSLIAYLRVYHTEPATDGLDLFATAPRGGVTPPALFTTVPTAPQLRKRLEALEKSSVLARGVAGKEALTILRGFAAAEPTTLRHIAHTLIQAWEGIEERSSPVDIEIGIDEAQTLLSMCTTHDLIDGVDAVAEGLTAYFYARFERWGELMDVAADATVPKADVEPDASDADEENEEEEDERELMIQEALVTVAKALLDDDPEAARAGLAEAKSTGADETLIWAAMKTVVKSDPIAPA